MNLLITGAWQEAKAHIGGIEAMGHKVLLMQQEREALPCAPEWAEGVICNGLFLYHPIEDFKNLRFIQLTSAGYDRVDMEYARAHGIKVLNASGVYSIPMAEFAASGVLWLYKQARFFNENQAAHKWKKHRGLMELYGKKVTVIGCGGVGTECAKRFSAFGCRVTGLDIAVREDESYEAILPLDKTDETLRNTNVLILTLPLTQETERFMDRRRLELLPKNAVVVSISRGRVIDEAALTELLSAGRLMGAVLDVFEQEPLPAESPLWDMDNVILTPHNSFVGEGNGERLGRVILGNLR